MLYSKTPVLLSHSIVIVVYRALLDGIGGKINRAGARLDKEGIKNIGEVIGSSY